MAEDTNDWYGGVVDPQTGEPISYGQNIPFSPAALPITARDLYGPNLLPLPMLPQQSAQPMPPQMPQRSAMQMMIDNPGMEAGGFRGMAPLPAQGALPMQVGLPNMNPQQVPQLAMNLAAQVAMQNAGGAPGNHPIQHTDFWRDKQAQRMERDYGMAALPVKNDLLNTQAALTKLHLDMGTATAPFEIQAAAQRVAMNQGSMQDHAALQQYRRQRALQQTASNAAAMHADQEAYKHPVNGTPVAGLTASEAANARKRFIENATAMGHSAYEAESVYDASLVAARRKRDDALSKMATQAQQLKASEAATALRLTKGREAEYDMSPEGRESKWAKDNGVVLANDASIPDGARYPTVKSPHSGKEYVKLPNPTMRPVNEDNTGLLSNEDRVDAYDALISTGKTAQAGKILKTLEAEGLTIVRNAKGGYELAPLPSKSPQGTTSTGKSWSVQKQ